MEMSQIDGYNTLVNRIKKSQQILNLFEKKNEGIKNPRTLGVQGLSFQFERYNKTLGVQTTADLTSVFYRINVWFAWYK